MCTKRRRKRNGAFQHEIMKPANFASKTVSERLGRGPDSRATRERHTRHLRKIHGDSSCKDLDP
jgi:hypothetical protein